jgi:N-acyl homoserine lactone hydrolase
MHVIPLHLADVTYPPGHPRTGVGPVFAFAVRTESGVLLVDTGIGPPHPLIDRLYQPVRYSLEDALAAHNIAMTEITAIVNTHLHFDHCGGNALFPGVPAFVQRAEREAARAPAYTVPEWLTYEGARFELLDGDAEITPAVRRSVRTIATPGHTPGHQSVLVSDAEEAIVIAGQAVETAADFRDAIERPNAHPDTAANAQKLLDLAPARVYFSHDRVYWAPGVAL